jgi:hypothetical protein
MLLEELGKLKKSASSGLEPMTLPQPTVLPHAHSTCREDGIFNTFHIVAYLLKARIVKSAETTIARKQHGNNI